MKKRILLLEDDFALGETIQEVLENSNYKVDYVTRGNEAIELSYENRYSLYIFDINVPDIDGLDILKSLRHADDETPAIFISAMTDLKTVLKGFEVGAYDFIKKPFYAQELIVKVNLKLQDNNEVIKYKNLEYFTKNKQLLKDGELISLGEVGSLVFELFIHNIGRVITKDELYECMNNPSATALRFHISKVNKTTGIEIKNVRAIGYIIE